jgi:hypothetical protein
MERRGNRKITEEELEVIANWTREARVNNAVVDMVIDGLVSIDVQDREPTFALTAGGEIAAEIISDKKG